MIPPVTLDFANGGLDRFGRKVRMSFKNSAGNTLHNYQYTYDKNGNRLSARITQAGHDNDRSYTYAYDRLNRLVNAERGTLTGGQISIGGIGQEWNLDLLGNWTGISQTEGHIEYTIADTSPGFDPGLDDEVRTLDHHVNSVNEIRAVEQFFQNARTTEGYAYDAGGNLIFDGQRLYQYDAWNHIRKVYDKGTLAVDGSNNLTGAPGQLVAAYDFDALGRRVAKHLGNSNPVHEYFYYDGNRILEHYKGTGASPLLHRQYVYGEDYIDGVAAYFDPAGAHHFILQDANYNVVGITDAGGNLLQQYNFEPYGDRSAVESVSGSTVSSIDWKIQPQLLLTDKGQQGLTHDPETGGIDNRNRLLLPPLGRFAQRDMRETALLIVSALISNAQSTVVSISFRPGMQYDDGDNLYGYLRNNPASRRDPSGLMSSFDYFDEGEELMLSIVGERTANLAELKDRFGQAIELGKLIGGAAFSFVPGGDIALLIGTAALGNATPEDVLMAGASLLGGAALWKGGQLLARGFSKFAKSFRSLRRVDNVAVDTMVLVRGLERGEMAALDKALAGRAPIVSITAAKEFLEKGDVNVLRRFLVERGGKIADAATEEQVQNLIEQANVLGRRLKSADAHVVGSAVRESVPLLTDDHRLAKFLEAVGIAVERY